MNSWCFPALASMIYFKRLMLSLELMQNTSNLLYLGFSCLFLFLMKGFRYHYSIYFYSIHSFKLNSFFQIKFFLQFHAGCFTACFLTNCCNAIINLYL